MAGSPTRIFQGLTLVELQAIRTATLLRITTGDITQLSGAQKSSTIEFMDPKDVLFEVNYEIRVLNGTLGPSIIYDDFTGIRRMPNTISA